MKNSLFVSVAVSFSCVLLIVAGSQNASPAQQPNELPQQAFDLLEKRCGQCHGETGSNKDMMLISRTGRDDLASKRSATEKKLLIDTAKPEASLLYLRITGKHPNGFMPPSYAAAPAHLTPAEQATILKWIQAGAPDWKNARQVRPQRRFISNANILQSINHDLAKLDEDRQKDTRYFTLTHLYNAGVSETEIAAYRDGLKRLLNSLSWEGEIIKPESIDPEQTIFRINLKKYGWKTSTWQTILSLYPYNIRSSDAPFTTVCKTTECELPFIRADWFVTHAALPPLYHDILELPSGKGADVALEKKLLDARGTRDGEQDITQSPGDRVWSSGFRKSGVSSNNRGLEWHQCLYGYYVKSNDFSDVTGFQNLKVHPLDFKRAGGEIIFGLPNGMQAYMLVGKDGTRLDVAPSNIVSNDRSTTKDKNIYNGLSCMGCHTQGMIEGFDIEEVRNAIARFPDGNTRRLGLKLYSERAQIQKLLDDGKKRFREALAKLNSVAGTNEPIVALAEKFQGDVDAELASAELGLPPAKFKEIITTLNDPVLNDLKDGKVARKAWEEQISVVVGRIPGATYVAVIIPDNPEKREPPHEKEKRAKFDPQDGWIALFDGDELSEWANKANTPAAWKLQAGFLPGTSDLVTRDQFRDYQLHLEFNLAYMPDKKGDLRSNSGVMLNGQYEIQILDSVNNPSARAQGCGAIQHQKDPDRNMCRAPGEWQTYDITFRSPRLDATGAVVEKPRVTLVWNGEKVHDDVEIEVPNYPRGLRSRTDLMLAAGPIILQDYACPVKFRNIWIKPAPSTPPVGGNSGGVKTPSSPATSGKLTREQQIQADQLLVGLWAPNGTLVNKFASRVTPDAVRLALSKGANPDARNSGWNETTLGYAAHNGLVSVAEILINAGAKIDESENRGGTSPLMEAAATDQRPVAKVLIDHGANVNYKSETTGATALIVAASFCRPDLTRFLLSKGANVNARDVEGKSALYHAQHPSLFYGRPPDPSAQAQTIALLRSAGSPE